MLTAMFKLRRLRVTLKRGKSEQGVRILGNSTPEI